MIYNSSKTIEDIYNKVNSNTSFFFPTYTLMAMILNIHRQLHNIAPSSSKINVASLIHPSDSNDPMMDSNEMMGHSATTTTTTIATSSTATTTTDDMLPPYPPTASTSSLSTSVEQSYHPLHPNATTTSTSPFYLRLPPIMFENTTSPSLSSPNKEFYKQSRRSGSEDIRRTSQQQHRPYYEATASLQRGRESSPIMIPGSSSSHHIINLHQPQSHSSSLQPQQQALHPHQQQHQQPYHLPASRRSSKHSSPTIAPPSLPSSSPSIELRPDRPELILQTKPIFPSHIHAQEDVVHLPSLREQFGGLVVPAPSDQEKQDEQQDVGPSHTSGSRMEVGGGIFEASKESNRRTSR
ncbi:hypothetical protein BDA99DRAFT_95222 [Phascolomyces articulosus]|uniref:Uncharacterized protein n=1 Tax=Phascolomyces articulosus TaxID=60185 RepID=A0AAD5KB29_9FUNG|nr:hypothetical protein BDA99DRAFT_95222 [Phascolomyces articulosus]